MNCVKQFNVLMNEIVNVFCTISILLLILLGECMIQCMKELVIYYILKISQSVRITILGNKETFLKETKKLLKKPLKIFFKHIKIICQALHSHQGVSWYGAAGRLLV